jgi:hypothetical protein
MPILSESAFRVSSAVMIDFSTTRARCDATALTAAGRG